MNTKNPKYKEYLRLNREINDLCKRYYEIAEKKPNKYRNNHYYIGKQGAIDYTEVKEKFHYKAHITYWGSKRYRGKSPKTEIVTRRIYPFYHEDLIELDLFNPLIGTFANRNNLFNCKISANYYYSLPQNLKDYFYKRKDIWASWNNNNIVVFDYYFKYDIPIKEVEYNIEVERYHILSDIQKAHDFLEYKQDKLGRDCGFYRYRRSWKKAAKAKRSRAILKQQLREIKDFNEDYDLAHKYHYPHNDKWFYD